MVDLENITARSALDPLDSVIGGPTDAGVTLTEIPFQTRLVLRGQLADKTFTAAVKDALGIAPPTEPGTVASAKASRVLWTGPNEWMIYSDDTNLAATMTHAVAGMYAAVTEVTEHYTLIRLSGKHARDVMIKGCAIDLHPREFGPANACKAISAASRCCSTRSTRRQPTTYWSEPVSLNISGCIWKMRGWSSAYGSRLADKRCPAKLTRL